MPVGTQGTVKAMSQEELAAMGFEIILGNTYHLYLRPGTELIERAGGLHKFINWGGSILTDSGGFQVFSLEHIRKIGEDGVVFRSYVDGSYHEFTPERVMQIQSELGADIVMAFDECAPYPCEKDYAAEAMTRTHEWARRSQAAADPSQSFFGIVQGSVYADLRERSAKFIASLDTDGIAIGGVSVGEGKELMMNAVEWTVPHLPESKPRYLMGVGTPEDLHRRRNARDRHVRLRAADPARPKRLPLHHLRPRQHQEQPLHRRPRPDRPRMRLLGVPELFRGLSASSL